MNRILIVILSIVITSLPVVSCGNASHESGKIIVFHAGSLSTPLAAIKKEYEARNSGVEILLEASGSIQAARKITDLKKPCDIIASADYRVIDKYLIPLYADWNIKFAGNRMVLCYTEHSRYAGEITEKNWFHILKKRGVTWGHSDQNLDPCGYRALMVIQLAERFYKMPGLYAGLLANRPVENIRPKSVELISLLQTGHLDYAWEYLSVAVQHKLPYISLPDEINLGNYRFNGKYSTATVSVTGERPGSLITMKGESCTYGITILKNSHNRKAAIEFLAYLLDPEGGLTIFEKMGQPPISPCHVRDDAVKNAIPSELHHLLSTEF
ncbi:MAG: tungstate ABC transporter substrate-binding protein WtpA [Spirochaetes bacterium]|nr:tungstate ABC transporter substrate-binding protein WtpA [Spirochaetota bacterium]